MEKIGNVAENITKSINDSDRELDGHENSLDRLEKYKDSNHTIQSIAKAVVEVHRVFSFYYRELWLKDAEDEGYLESWIDELFEEGIDARAIERAISDIKNDVRFETYPPNFSQFLDACKKQERVNYNLPTKDEAYMIACGKRDIHIKDAHSVVRETVRRVEEYRVKHDPSIKHEFYRVYTDVCKEFTDNDGNVSFNENRQDLEDFKDEKVIDSEPPVSKEKARSYLQDILSSD